MALRDQPYIPLYVQDFLTDEKLMECSASATGVYIRIMCVMHKSEIYGKILLKQKDKQSGNQIKDFALKLVRHLPYDLDTILAGIKELCQEKCLEINGDFLIQKRMVSDGELSLIRSESGSKGGKITQSKHKKFARAKTQANTEYEIEYENKDESVLNTGGVGENSKPIKKNDMSTAKDTEGIPLPFQGPEFAAKWELWLKYRRERRLPKYVPTGLKGTFTKLKRISGDDVQTAMAIIQQSIDDNYQGLFPLKQQFNGTHKREPSAAGKTIEFDRP